MVSSSFPLLLIETESWKNGERIDSQLEFVKGKGIFPFLFDSHHNEGHYVNNHCCLFFQNMTVKNRAQDPHPGAVTQSWHCPGKRWSTVYARDYRRIFVQVIDIDISMYFNFNHEINQVIKNQAPHFEGKGFIRDMGIQWHLKKKRNGILTHTSDVDIGRTIHSNLNWKENGKKCEIP